MKNIHPRFFLICFFWVTISAVAPGEPVMPCPPNGCLCPPLWFTENTDFGTSHNNKTTESDGKIVVHNLT